MKKTCVHCGKELTGRKLKYCGERCQYMFLSIKNESFSGYSKSQNLRMTRAGRSQRAGGVGCRYN